MCGWLAIGEGACGAHGWRALRAHGWRPCGAYGDSFVVHAIGQGEQVGGMWYFFAHMAH